MSSPSKSGSLSERVPLLAYAREFTHAPGRLATAAIIAIIKHSPVLAIPAYTAYVIDVVLPQRDLEALGLCAVGMLGLIIMNMAMHPLYIHYYSKVRREVALRLRAKLCERFQQLVFAYHDNFKTGRLHSKVMMDVEKLDHISQAFLDPLLVSVLTAIVAITTVIIIEPWFALILFVFVPMVMAVIFRARRRLEKKFHQLRTEQEKLNAEVGDMLSMLPLSRAHATEHLDLKRIGDRLVGVRDMGVKTDLHTNILQSRIWGLSQMVGISVLTLGGLLVVWGRISTGDVVMFLTFIGMTVGTISGVLSMAPQFFEASEAYRSIQEVLSHPEVEENDGKPDIAVLDGRIEFRDVWFTYPGRNKPVLKSLNLKVEPNQTIALVGASGAGKTTLVKLLLGFYRPMQGDIYIDDTPMSGFNLRSFRRQIGIVTQDTFMFNGTILQNLVHGREDVPMEDVRESARQANALEFIEMLEKGFDTEIGDRGVRLSGGQKQRIAIARALLRKPRLLILDEATSALDGHSEKLVQDALETLMRDRTTFVIAHRLSTIRNADRILVFDDGRIVEDGAHDLLIQQGGVYAKLVEIQRAV